MNLGQFIKEKRLKNNLTQEYIANYVGVAKGTISKWERGAIKCMRFDKITKLAIVLNVPVMDILKLGK